MIRKLHGLKEISVNIGRQEFPNCFAVFCYGRKGDNSGAPSVKKIY